MGRKREEEFETRYVDLGVYLLLQRAMQTAPKKGGKKRET